MATTVKSLDVCSKSKVGFTKVVRLTDQQRELVSQNLGLIAVHLRRNVANLSEPRRDREWEDLFQEGCVGLANAAIRYDADSGIPFAAYAFPRIHNAVSRALQRKFSTVYVPPRRAPSNRNAPGHRSDPTKPTESLRPCVVELDDRIMAAMQARSQYDDSVVDGETIGDRIRERIDAAVVTAKRGVGNNRAGRGDRLELVELLLRERILLPDEENKRALRQIARDTNSSYARVAQCEKQLLSAMHEVLSGDPELRVLTRKMRQHPDGPHQAMDDNTQREIADECAGELADRYESGDGVLRAKMLHRLIEQTESDLAGLVANSMAKLDPSKQRRLLGEFGSRPCSTRSKV